jgi:hypothetical protein
MFCKNCGCQLPDDSSFCPRCGFPVNFQPEYEQHPTNTASGLCFAGFIVSILGLFSWFNILSIIGLALSIWGVKQAKERHLRLRTLGIIGIAVACFGLADLILSLTLMGSCLSLLPFLY